MGEFAEDSATKWARQAIAAKNRLTAPDAKLLEDIFEKRLSDLSISSVSGGVPNRDAAEAAGTASENGASPEPQGIDKAGPEGIDKSMLALGTPKRHRNKDHLRFVPCLLCGRKPSDAHHILPPPPPLGRKASDEFTVPLCRSHHRSVHRAGNEQVWWQQAGIDPLKVARKLWKHTHTDERRIKPDPARTPAIASDRAAEPEGPAPTTQSPI